MNGTDLFAGFSLANVLFDVCALVRDDSLVSSIRPCSQAQNLLLLHFRPDLPRRSPVETY
jgi:hypothetical protein